MWNTLKLIQWTADYFDKKGILTPRLDAEILLAHTLKCPRIDLYTNHEREVPEKDRARFKLWVERRALREPLQHIVGETEFWGLKIQVTPDVLIPRPETELLVEACLKTSPPAPLLSKERAADARRPGEVGLSILEIGTGSGCISIALAKHLPQASMIATEISKEAIEVARGNIKAHRLEDRIHLLLADVAPWRVFESEERSFHLIISNPPYVPTCEIASLQPEVRDFDPRLALDGGPEGLDVIGRILKQAPSFLVSGGHLLLEIGEGQGDLLCERWSQLSSLKLTGFVRDYAGTERILHAKR